MGSPDEIRHGRAEEMTMGPRGYADQEFQADLQELLTAARGMTEGKFCQIVNVRARGAIG
jgi:hypothetical protein